MYTCLILEGYGKRKRYGMFISYNDASKYMLKYHRHLKIYVKLLKMPLKLNSGPQWQNINSRYRLEKR